MIYKNYKKKEKDITSMQNASKDSIANNSRGLMGINLKPSLAYAVLGVSIISLISFIISVTLNNFITEKIIGGFFMAGEVKIFNPLDLLLLFNFTGLGIDASILDRLNLMSMTLSGAPIVILLIPFAIFSTFGMHMAKSDNKSDKSVSLKNILLTGLFYGAILFIISIVYKSNINIDMPFGMGSVVLQKDFMPLSALLKGIFASTIPLLFGYMIYWKFSKKVELVGKYTFLFNSVFIITISILLLFMATWIFTKMGLDLDSIFGFDLGMLEKLPAVIKLAQLAVYLFLFINFGVIGGEGNLIGEKISLFTNIDYIKSELGFIGLIFIFLLTIIPITAFFIHGRRSNKENNKNFIFTIIVYSVLVGILAYMSSIKMLSSGESGLLSRFIKILDEDVVLGFGVLSSIIGSFVLAMISSLAGYFLPIGKELFDKKNHSNQKNIEN